jgi:signal transduction histidine kinase
MTVIAPAIFLTAAWLAAAILAIGGVLGGHRLSSLSHSQLAEITALAAGGAVVILITLLLAGSFARRIARDLTGLTIAARQLAAGQLVQASEVDVEAGSPAESSTRRGSRTTEIAQATGAIAGLQDAAAAAAASEAGMRDGLRQVIVSLARRNQSLLQRQLRLIDALEQKAADPAALADLFALDHLTTRMRRHAESLAILAGAAPGRSWRDPVPVIDVIRGAMAEVEDYQRVAVLTQAEDAISGSAAADMIHLLAELIENATLFSPSGTPVEVRAGRVANGFAIEVDDRGLGIEPDQLTAINQEMENPPDFDLANSDRLGLFVGGKLAARYGVRVSLRASPYGGTTAIVLLPNNIVVPAGGVGIALQPAIVHPAIAGTSSSDARTVEPLALVGPRRVPPAPRAAESAIGTAPAGDPWPVSPVQAVPPVQPAPPTPLTAPRRPAEPAAQAARDVPPGRPVLPSRTRRMASTAPPAARAPGTAPQTTWRGSDSAGPAAPPAWGDLDSAARPASPAASPPAGPAPRPGGTIPAAAIAGSAVPEPTITGSTADSSVVPGRTGPGPAATGPTIAGSVIRDTAAADTAPGPAAPGPAVADSAVAGPAMPRRLPASGPADPERPAAAPSIASVWSVPPGRSVFSPAETPPATSARPAPDSGASASPGPAASPASSTGPGPAATAAARAPETAAGTTADRTTGQPGFGGQGSSPGGSSPGGSSPGGGTYRGLPRRTRQASLSPHLRDAPTTAGRSSASGPLPAPVEERAPEEARNLAASLQSGWQRGRAAGLPDVSGSSAAGSDQAGRDSASGSGEET